MRSVWLAVFFGLSTTVMGILSLIASLFSSRAGRAFARPWAKANLWAAGIRVRVEGAENEPRAGYVAAANHSSAADIGAVLAGLASDVCWVSKSSLNKAPILGWHLKRVHIPVMRKKGGGTEAFLQLGGLRIAQGAAVVIFPEGTRNRGDGEMLPFRSGAFRLAISANAPILPVALVGSRGVWPPGQQLPGKGEIIVRMGAPLMPAPGETPEEMGARTRATLEELLAG